MNENNKLGGTPYSGLYGEALHTRGRDFTLEVYEVAGIAFNVYYRVSFGGSRYFHELPFLANSSIRKGKVLECGAPPV